METTIETITIQHLLARALLLSEGGRQRLAELLKREQDEPLPEHASVDEEIELYLADACSSGRAAGIAGVTRWDIMDRLKERGIKVPIAGHRTAEEIDALAEELKLQGIL